MGGKNLCKTKAVYLDQSLKISISEIKEEGMGVGVRFKYEEYIEYVDSKNHDKMRKPCKCQKRLLGIPYRFFFYKLREKRRRTPISLVEFYIKKHKKIMSHR